MRQSHTPRLQLAVRSIASPCHGDDAENQDNYLVIDPQGRAEYLLDQRCHVVQRSGWPAGHMRLAVLDGMGGHASGRQIAEAIVSRLACLPAFDALRELEAALETLHHTVQAEFAGSSTTPGATLTLIEVPAHGPALLFHVGDSRLYALREQGLELLTIDHSPPTAFALRGMLDEAQWRHQVLAEDRCAISQAFGMGNSLAQPGSMQPELLALGEAQLPPWLAHLPDRRDLALHAGDTWLLSTDGLWAYDAPLHFMGSIASRLRQPYSSVNALADAVLQQHCEAASYARRADNTTFIVIRVLR
jgi:serine/threonine protein phosphatase PrpC